MNYRKKNSKRTRKRKLIKKYGSWETANWYYDNFIDLIINKKKYYRRRNKREWVKIWKYTE